MSLRLIGVDGCRAGWIAVIRDGEDGWPRQKIYPNFSFLLEEAGPEAWIAVDMPIGLPDRTSAGGRGAERAVRPLLKERQSSVFSIPARDAVYARDYAAACELALATSDPPRKVSRQGFNLFAKICEIDALMTPQRQEHVREVHPELAFCVLNGGDPMATPKKIKGKVNPDGIAERRALLSRRGMPEDFLAGTPARGAALDDFIDACVCCLVAGRLARGEARSFPQFPERDRKGLHIAIWA